MSVSKVFKTFVERSLERIPPRRLLASRARGFARYSDAAMPSRIVASSSGLEKKGE